VERRRSWTSCLVSCAAGSDNGVPRASTPIENGTVTGRHTGTSLAGMQGQSHRKEPAWAFLPGSAWPRCRRREAPLPIAGRDAEGVVVTALIAMAGALIGGFAAACSRLSVEGAVASSWTVGGVIVRLVVYGPNDLRCRPFGRWRDRGHVTVSYWRHLASRDPASSPKRPAVRSRTAPPPNP
jgi:hypothetical protein